MARDIIARDREARRRGVPQNTIAKIEQAMVKAFKAGQAALLDNRIPSAQSPDKPIDWLEIPPRARQTLSFMTYCYSQRYARVFSSASPNPKDAPDEIEMFIENGRKRWVFVSNFGRSDHSVADGSVAPLLRLGLLKPRPDQNERYILTPAGIAAAKVYWRRSDMDDPTLPREGMR